MKASTVKENQNHPFFQMNSKLRSEFASFLLRISELEINVERQRLDLAYNEFYDQETAFHLVDEKGKGRIKKKEI